MPDGIDVRILNLLQNAGRRSNQMFAEQVSLLPSPCLLRVRRLEETGVLPGYVAPRDARNVGLDLLAYVALKLEKSGKMSIEGFKAPAQVRPEVSTWYAVAGDMDCLLRLRAPGALAFFALCDATAAEAAGCD